MLKILTAPARTLSAITLSMMFQVSAYAFDTYEIVYDNSTHLITKAPAGFADSVPDFDVNVYQRINPSIAHLTPTQAVDFLYSAMAEKNTNLPFLFWIPHRHGLDTVEWDLNAFIGCNDTDSLNVLMDEYKGTFQDSYVEMPESPELMHAHFFHFIQEKINGALSRKNPSHIPYSIPLKPHQVSQTDEADIINGTMDDIDLGFKQNSINDFLSKPNSRLCWYNSLTYRS